MATVSDASATGLPSQAHTGVMFSLSLGVDEEYWKHVKHPSLQFGVGWQVKVYGMHICTHAP